MDLLHFRLNPRRSNHPKPFPCIPGKTRHFLLFEDQMSLCNYKYAMVLKFNDVSVGHVPKFLSKICYIYQKHGGTIIVRVTGERQYSKDLGQGGMELHAKNIF